MRSLRLVALGVNAALVLYYARFFALVRQDPATIVQVCLLLIASAIVVASERATWPVSAVQVRVAAVLAFVSAMAITVWADQGSHSISDTLNRAVPVICVVVACVIGLASVRASADPHALGG